MLDSPDGAPSREPVIERCQPCARNRKNPRHKLLKIEAIKKKFLACQKLHDAGFF
jgi:hypothetical protein